MKPRLAAAKVDRQVGPCQLQPAIEVEHRVAPVSSRRDMQFFYAVLTVARGRSLPAGVSPAPFHTLLERLTGASRPLRGAGLSAARHAR